MRLIRRNMTRDVSNEEMKTIRQSLAQAGIYFDKLYINQAYFNSNFTIQATNGKQNKSHKHFWRKLLCGSSKYSDAKQSTTGTQTVLTVRDDTELIPPAHTRRQRIPPPENTYDRRRSRPVNREHPHYHYQQPIRRRRSSLVTRSLQVQRPKQINDDDDDDDEFTV